MEKAIPNARIACESLKPPQHCVDLSKVTEAVVHPDVGRVLNLTRGPQILQGYQVLERGVYERERRFSVRPGLSGFAEASFEMRQVLTGTVLYSHCIHEDGCLPFALARRSV